LNVFESVLLRKNVDVGNAFVFAHMHEWILDPKVPDQQLYLYCLRVLAHLAD
jgi:hypothetical protein